MTTLLDLASARFVSLTTFRKTGIGVATPVWIARDGDELVVTTPVDSGKVKRVRNDGRVTVQPCSRMGKVDEDAPLLEAHAVIVEDEAEVERLGGVFASKYGLEYRIFLFIERRVSKGEQKRRVMLRLSPA